MKTVAVREVCKEWTRILQENAGSQVSVTNRGEIVAYIRVPARKKGQKVKMPDFRARMKAIFGDRMIPADALEALDEANKSKY